VRNPACNKILHEQPVSFTFRGPQPRKRLEVMPVHQEAAFVDVSHLGLNVHHGVLVQAPAWIIEHVTVDQVGNPALLQHRLEELGHVVVIAAWEAQEFSLRIFRRDIGRFVAVAAGFPSPEIPDPGILDVVADQAVSLVRRVVTDDNLKVPFRLKLKRIERKHEVFRLIVGRENERALGVRHQV